MTPDVWVTLVVGLATPVATVVVAWINRSRNRRPDQQEKDEHDKPGDPT